MAAKARPKAGKGRPAEVVLGARTLGRIRHAVLRPEAEAAIARGERVTLLSGGADPDAPVETLLLPGGRAVQSAGGHVSRGTWTGGRLHTDAGIHALDADGLCFCRDCEAAGGFCVDDDE